MHLSQTELAHNKLVEDTCKSGEAICEDITSRGAHFIHMVMGISGEAGELLDQIKKHVIYNRPLDLENIVEELGDLEYYMNGLRRSLGISREEILQYNIDKLRKRYGDSYSDQAAQARIDKDPNLFLQEVAEDEEDDTCPPSTNDDL